MSSTLIDSVKNVACLIQLFENESCSLDRMQQSAMIRVY